MIKKKIRPEIVRPDLWTPKYIACVCTKELSHELLGWLSTIWAYTTATPIVIGDYPATIYARYLAGNVKKKLIYYPWLSGSALDKAKIKKVKSHSSYWKERIIWWKCEGFRRLFEYGYDDILFTDSDITFLRDVGYFKEEVILSPFYWGPNSASVEALHGTFNAGYLAARNGRFAEKWLEYYEDGVGGFYEQGCLNNLSKDFDVGLFNICHNHGKWREADPRQDCISIHYHRQEKCRRPYEIRAHIMIEAAIKKALDLLCKFDYNIIVNYDFNMQSPEFHPCS